MGAQDSAVGAGARPAASRLGYLLLFHVAPAAFFCLVAYARLMALGAYLSAGPGGDDLGAYAGFAAGVLHRGLVIVFVGLSALLFAIRRPPRRRLNDPVATAVALLGTFGMTAVALAPYKTDDAVVLAIADFVLTVGNAAAILALTQLGRNLSITPAARGLVTTGCYGVVRHPLYAAEIVLSLGTLLPVLSIWTAALFAAFVLLQVRRTYYEEAVLGSVFPEYAQYQRRVPRLIPLLHRRAAG